jgi:hypothetical protein
VRGLGAIGFFNDLGCNRCENDIDQTCTTNADCPEAPEPQLCTCVGYQPDRPIDQPPNDVLLDDDVTGSSGVPNPDGFRNIDFDVMEVGNGLDPVDYALVRNDWFSLLNQANAAVSNGRVPFLPGTGVSDSHRNTLESAGYFRTYVLGVGDDAGALDGQAFDESVRGGRMVATTGPYIEFSIHDPAGGHGEIGGTLHPAGPEVILRIRVLATNWIPVEEVRVIANGQVLEGLSFDAESDPAVESPPARPWSRSPARVERFQTEVTLPLAQDTWLLVEAGAKLDDAPAPDPFVDAIVPGFVSLAFTNPIFVDLDGDGFDPPGVIGDAGPAASPGWAGAVERRNVRERREHFSIRRLRIPAQSAQRALEQTSP